jgi:CheY-like chemotaxis protein
MSRMLTRPMLSRLLIVEDDQLQQSVLKTVLEGRGYDIEVASDGLTAVRMLRDGHFDLALIDYNLPEIDGFASARLVHDLMPDADRPRLIAVTAALDSLGSRDRLDGVFDAIVPKPLDFALLLDLIGTQLSACAAEQAAQVAAATWRGFGLPGAPAALVLPAPTAAQAQVLRCFFDLSGQRAPDLVLLLGADATQPAEAARALAATFALPFVDLAGTYTTADAVFSATDTATWRAVAAAILRFGKHRRLVCGAALESPDLDTRLLVYLFLCGQPFAPSLATSTPACVRYPGFFPEVAGRLAAERMASQGLLDRQFFERFHICDDCGSARLNARTECRDCRSADLREGPAIRHLGCGHRALAAAFATGPQRCCPRCRAPWYEHGHEFVAAGHGTSCGGCGTANPERAVGFACLDCGAHTCAEAAQTRDAYAYTLTPEGAARLGPEAWIAFGARGRHDVPQVERVEPATAAEATEETGIRFRPRESTVAS